MVATPSMHATRRLSSIQVLRAAAAILVLYAHMFKELLVTTNGLFVDTLNLHVSGQAGVDLFFVISGFIMMYVSGNDHGPAAARLFFFKRVIRVVPLYWVFTTLTILISLLWEAAKNHNDMSLTYILGSYLFIPFERGSDLHFTPALGVGWTLNYEMAFYAVFALCILAPRKYWLALITGILALFALAGLVVSREALPQLWFWTRPIIVEFGAGALLSAIYGQGIRLPKAVCLAFAGAGLVWWQIASNVALDPTLQELRLFTWGIPSVLILASVVFLPATARPSKPESLWYRLAVRAGDGSYSLYLVHIFVIRFATLFLPMQLLGPAYIPVYIALVTVCALVFADAVFTYLERPSNKLGRVLLDARRQRSVSP